MENNIEDKKIKEAFRNQEGNLDTESDKSLGERHTKAFEAIVAFVKDLASVFSTKNITPLTLYNRLVDHIKLSDKEAISKAITGFAEFFDKHGKDIFENMMHNIPQGTKINYGDGRAVHIPIQMYIYRSEPGTKETIRQHLMTIAALIQPEKISAVPVIDAPPASGYKIDTSTTEGRFIDEIMQKANKSLTGLNMDNPMMATMALFQSGIMGDMMNGLQQGVGSGQMDMIKLMGMMQSAMGDMMKQSTPQSASQPEEKSSSPQSPKISSLETKTVEKEKK